MRRPLAALAVIVPCLAIAAVSIAGNLNPPAGVIAPTMKPLNDVEPRVAINATNTPGDSDSVFKISTPGSYYLTAGFTVPPTMAGIEIASSHVTIDLNGCTITGITTLAAVQVSLAGRKNITIRNGHIGLCGEGIDLTSDDGGTITAGGTIENIDVTGTSGVGITAGDTFNIRGCTMADNASAGLLCADSCVITECVARNNSGAGFSTGADCVLSRCVSSLNTLYGFQLPSGVIADHCEASSNTSIGFLATTNCSLSQCSAISNTNIGISAANNARVTDCLASFNQSDGILVSQNCLVSRNLCYLNGFSGTGAGIRVIGDDCRVEDNNCTKNDWGVNVTSSGNFIIRNICSGNTTNWEIVAGNRCLVVLSSSGGAISGNAGGASPGSTDPNANFTQ